MNKTLLDEAWHALFHLDIRAIEPHIGPKQTKEAYELACVEGERVRKLLEAELGYSATACVKD